MSSRWGAALAAAVLLLPPVFILAWSDKAIVDDSWIGYRHSYNIVAGRGPVFNAGERVEGFTNLLWTLITTIPILLRIRPDAFSAVLGGLLAGFATARAWGLSRRLGVPAAASAAATLLLSFYPGYWVSSVGGMEGGLFGVLLVESAACVLLLRSPLLLGLLGGLLFATRPESIGLFPAFLIVQLWVRRLKNGAGPGATRETVVRGVAPMAVVWLGLVGAITAWRIGYYGHALPNSVAAKSVPLSDTAMLWTNAKAGALYARGFALSAPALVGAALLGFVLTWRSPAAWLCTMLCAGAIAVALIHGGDWMPHHRLLSVYSPLAVVPAALGFERVRRAASARWWGEGAAALCAAAAVGGAVISCVHRPWREAPTPRLQQAAPQYGTIAKALLPALLPDDKVATEGLGLFGYALPDHYVHDFFGLTDEHIAHHGTGRDIYGKVDYAYTINTVRPQVIVLQSGDTHILRGFKKFTPAPYEELYETYKVGVRTPELWRQMMVSIRKDAAPRIAPALAPLDPERFIVEP